LSQNGYGTYSTINVQTSEPGMDFPKKQKRRYLVSNRNRKRLADALARRFTLSQNGYGAYSTINVQSSEPGMIFRKKNKP
tara:strand:+ start:753 stop:992 length:240 start_codon:yes stop_codon:yes gene_type:complete